MMLNGCLMVSCFVRTLSKFQLAFHRFFIAPPGSHSHLQENRGCHQGVGCSGLKHGAWWNMVKQVRQCPLGTFQNGGGVRNIVRGKALPDWHGVKPQQGRYKEILWNSLDPSQITESFLDRPHELRFENNHARIIKNPHSPKVTHSDLTGFYFCIYLPQIWLKALNAASMMVKHTPVTSFKTNLWWPKSVPAF